MKPIALHIFSLRDEARRDMRGVLQKVADIGYQGVEFFSLYGRTPAEVKPIVDDLGLAVCSAHMPLPTPENAGELIEFCHTLGIPRLIHTFRPEHLAALEGCREAAAKVRVALSLLEGSGIAFGLHNHWAAFQTVEGHLPEDILLAAAPEVFAEVDVYWAQVGCGDALGQVARLKRRVPLLHVKDGPVEPKEPMTAVGSGTLDIPALVRATDPDVLEWLIVEQDSSAGSMMEDVARSYRYLVAQGLGIGNR
ncbi:MAG: sugar phosphate isomerase/epimerase [Armatimonadetes bacterium]|nr:sugar phosphate isomerase/epimerase [Armatimonadota bacterium]